MSESDSDRSVTVIGLGSMGQAMTRAFLEAKYEVTVWNRTQAKAEAMVALGANRAETVGEALDANRVIVVSLTDYQAMYGVLGQATDRLAGKLIANLSSDSPNQTRAGANWVLEHGGQYLTGGFMSQGEDISHPNSYLYLSGPEAVYQDVKDLLRPLSPQEYLGTDYGLAQVFYQAHLMMFHPIMLALEQALATIERSGEDIDRFLHYARRDVSSLADFVVEFGEAAKQGGWADLASHKMMAAGAQHIIDASEEVGVDAALSHTAQQYWRRAIAASERTGEPVSTYRIIRGDVS